MRSTQPAPSQQNHTGNGTFNVVIAYEDFETGKQAKRAYDSLTSGLGAEFMFSSPMWKFDVLSIPKLQEMAIADAQGADMVMVACRGGAELHKSVREWIDGWIARGTRAAALVALFQCEPEECGPIHKYLSAAAARAGIEFLAQPDFRQNENFRDEHPARQSTSVAGLSTFSSRFGVSTTGLSN